MNLQPRGFGAGLGLMKAGAGAGGSLLIRVVQVVGEQQAGARGGLEGPHLISSIS